MGDVQTSFALVFKTQYRRQGKSLEAEECREERKKKREGEREREREVTWQRERERERNREREERK